MSMFYIGGELAQSRLGLPKSLTGVFQGVLLFSLLACDTLIYYRIRWQAARPSGALTRHPRFSTDNKGGLMESIALLHGCHAERGHRARLRGTGPVDQRTLGHRQPWRRRHDAGRRDRRLRRRRAPATTGSRSPRAPLAGALLAAAFGVLVIYLNTNQYATGLALSLFGSGFSAFIGIHASRKRSCRRTSALLHPRIWPTSRSSGPRCSGSTRWSTSRSRCLRAWPGSCTARAPGWCCARWANPPSRRMRWATRCGASA